MRLSHPTNAPMDLLRILKKDDCTFEGTNFLGPEQGFPVFGGQTMAQALEAAQSTMASDFRLHFMSTYFHRPVTMNKTVTYQVEDGKKGRMFVFKHVKATQDEKVVLVMDLCFMTHTTPRGINYQSADNKLYDTHYVGLKQWFEQNVSTGHADARENSIDDKLFKMFEYILDLQKHFSLEIGAPQGYKRQISIGLKENIGTQSYISSVLTLLSDFFLLESSLLILRDMSVEGTLSFVTSAQHTIHMHEHPDTAESSFMYLVECERFCNGIALCNGYMFDSKKKHLMTVTQEVVLQVGM